MKLQETWWNWGGIREHEHSNAKIRKVPMKIEPKVFFANERTFLSWMHSATFLSAASMGIIAYADENPWSQVYGITLLPVALGFIIYSIMQCEWLSYS